MGFPRDINVEIVHHRSFYLSMQLGEKNAKGQVRALILHGPLLH